jgi:hypothetical protein
MTITLRSGRITKETRTDRYQKRNQLKKIKHKCNRKQSSKQSQKQSSKQTSKHSLLKVLLNNAQKEALKYINLMCKQKNLMVENNIKLKYETYELVKFNKLVTMFDKYRVTINFNCYNNLRNISADTHYRNQFEVRTSNGCFDNELRKQWENNLFGNKYYKSLGCDRVKYGNLHVGTGKYNIRANGYGSCSLLLKNNIKQRCTFTYGDSCSQNSETVYTFDYPHMIYNRLDSHDFNKLLKQQPVALGRYVEVQIHGKIKLNRDVEAVMAPNLYKKKPDVLMYLKNMVKKNKINLIWY